MMGAMPVMLKVTELEPDGNTALVAVIVLGPDVDPKVSVVLDCDVTEEVVLLGVVLLGVGLKVSPGTLVVHATVPQGGGFGINVKLVQSTVTTRGLAICELMAPL